MGKFVYALMTAFAIEMSLWIFTGNEFARTAIYNLLSDPTSLTSATIYIVILAALTIFSLSAVLPGTFVSINIYALYAGLALAFITFGWNIVHLFTYLNGELAGLGTELSLIISMIVCGPILMFYLIAVVEWVRNN